MMKKITLSLLLVSMMIPMTLSAQKVKKDVLAVPSAAAIIWDFESGEQYDDWKAVDNDGDILTWRYHYNEGDPDTRMKTHGGEGLVQSASYNNFTGEILTPDNWLISPEVTLGGVLSFWACGQDADWCNEVFGVFVCVGNSIDPADFVQVGKDKTTKSVMTEYFFDLSKYAGQRGRFAIRHYKCTDQFWLNVDDVCLDINATYIPVPTKPTDLTADPSATTADVTWNGEEDDSWNLRYRVYNPNETQTFLWDFTVDNFESQLEDWIIKDANKDGYNWTLTDEGYDPTDIWSTQGNVCFLSVSYASGSLTPDNWLMTPEIPLGGTFKFWAKNDFYTDVLGVYVVTDEGEFQIGRDFEPQIVWTEYSFDTSEYDGQMGRIAIRHYNCENKYRVYVDYFSYVKEGDEPAEWIEVNGLTETQYTIEGLEPGTDYIVEVKAVAGDKETEWTKPVYFTTGIGVSVSATGYATLYYGNKNLVVPEGVEASAITVEGSSITKSKVYASGDIIPQGTGVLLQASQGDYVFGVTSEEGTAASVNMLRGSDEAEETTGGDIYYKLSLNANSDPESVGFYYGAVGGAAFINGAHKAYLALPAEQATSAKYVWFETTGISGMKAVENNSKDVYTVNGVRVNKSSDMPKGIYIVGEKKVVVK